MGFLSLCQEQKDYSTQTFLHDHRECLFLLMISVIHAEGIMFSVVITLPIFHYQVGEISCHGFQD